MKKTLFIILACTFGQYAMAQTPKWFKKAKKAQITIVTFNNEGDILNSGNGFYIDDKGTALANFNLFKGAASAKVVDANGKEYNVKTIDGANSLYDVIKFTVDTDKKTSPLTISSREGVKNEVVYIMPYPTAEKSSCITDTLKNIQKFEEKFNYYTLSKEINEKYTNCPIMSEEGEVMGMIQLPASDDSKHAFAISGNFGESLTTRGLSLGDSELASIGIRKALPEDENEASTFIFMARNMTDSLAYSTYLDEYIQQFPESGNGYLQRAEFDIVNANYEEAEKDFESAENISQKKDEVLYTWGRLIYELNLDKEYKMYKDWDFNKSLALLEEAEKINQQPIYTLQQGHILYAMKEYEKAYGKYMSLAETKMRSADNFLFAAECKRQLKADTLEILALQDSALNCFTKPYVKNAAPVLLARANTYMQLGQYRNAVIDLNEYEHLMADEVNAHFYYSREQLEMKCNMFQQAIDDIEKATAMAPDQPLYFAEKAVVYYRVGMFDEAIKSAQKAIEIKNDYAEAYRILGICQIENKQKEEALVSLGKAAELGDETAKRIIEEEKGK